MAVLSTFLLIMIMWCNFFYRGSGPDLSIMDPHHVSFIPKLVAVYGASSLTYWQKLNGIRLKACKIRHYHLLLCLILSGQVEVNPGPRPPKYPCGECSKAVVYGKEGGSIACDTCDRWFHRECMQMNSI